MFLKSKSTTLNSGRSTLHHIALSIDLEDYEPEMKRLEDWGSTFARWSTPGCVRSLYFADPEGLLGLCVTTERRVVATGRRLPERSGGTWL
jgi:hypothetical protein